MDPYGTRHSIFRVSDNTPLTLALCDQSFGNELNHCTTVVTHPYNGFEKQWVIHSAKAFSNPGSPFELNCLCQYIFIGIVKQISIANISEEALPESELRF